jgi:hypothetical protein
MIFADQVPIQCTEENLSVIEPIIITVRSRLYTGGGANYFVHIVARYEPDIDDFLHVLIARDFIEKEADRAYFYDTPQLIFDTAIDKIKEDPRMCGGSLCFCRIMPDHVDSRSHTDKFTVEGIINLIKSDYSQLSEEQIQKLFLPL